VRHPVGSPFARIASVFARVLVVKESNSGSLFVWNGGLVVKEVRGCNSNVKDSFNKVCVPLNSAPFFLECECSREWECECNWRARRVQREKHATIYNICTHIIIRIINININFIYKLNFKNKKLYIYKMYYFK